MKWIVAAGLLLVASMALAQEITPEPDEIPIAMPMVDPIDVRGNISVAGSSTVYLLTEQMVQRFEEAGYTDTISDESIGTGAGFERFCVAGDIDISNASRAIRDSELAQCAALDRTPLELRVGTDALVIVVSEQNTFIESLTLPQIALAFSTAESWQDIHPDFPAQPILRYAAGTESGTFDFFVEHVFANQDAPILAASNLQLSEDDNVLVRGVESSPFAIGFFGFAYYLENQERLRSVSVDGIAPNEQTAEDGTYPLSRPLFLYTDAGILREKPQVAAFLIYYLTHVNEEILDVGYFPASVAALNEARQALLDALDS